MSDHLPESFSLASILAEECVHHQEGLWVRMVGQDQTQVSCIAGGFLTVWATRDCRKMEIYSQGAEWDISGWEITKEKKKIRDQEISGKKLI